MAILKFITKNNPHTTYDGKYKDDDAVYDVLRYIMDESKTGGYYGSWAVDPPYCAYEMNLVAKFYHQQKGVRLSHWILNFEDDELRRIQKTYNCPLPMALLALGRDITKYYAARHQVVFAVHHIDERHPHIHCVLSAVSYVDGLKYHRGPEEFYAYKGYAARVLGRMGISLKIVQDHESTKIYQPSAL